MEFVEIEKIERKTDWAMSNLQSHNYYEVYFLVEGERKIFYENKMFNISAGTIYVIPPFCMHKTEGGPYKRININVSPKLLTNSQTAYLDAISGYAYKLENNLLNTITAILNNAITNSEKPTSDNINLATVNVVLSLLQNSILIPIEHNASLVDNKKDTLVLKIVSYLNENFAQKITLSSLAKTFYISVNTLCSRFQTSMHCSIVQYLNCVRINYAKNLLITTNKNMSEIAELCGYSSANYFCLIFTKSVGLSPLNYKKCK